MDLAPKLIDVAVPSDPEGAVVVLHGGAGRRRSMMVSPAQLSVLRMVPIARAIARRGHGRLAVFRLLNSTRGWDTEHTPVSDARWALDELSRRLEQPVPVSLVGHSLGGRAALLSAAEPEVQSVVALAPWVYPEDVPAGLDGQAILIVHGSADRIASPQRSAALARRLSRHASVGYVSVRGARHAMLRRHAVFQRLAGQFVTSTLLGTALPEPLARLYAGDPRVEV